MHASVRDIVAYCNSDICSNGIAVMAIAPNVIPRSEATWESPK